MAGIDLLRSQLMIIRAALDAAFSMLNDLEAEDICPHENREDLTGFGQAAGSHWKCADCGEEVLNGHSVSAG